MLRSEFTRGVRPLDANPFNPFGQLCEPTLLVIAEHVVLDREATDLESAHVVQGIVVTLGLNRL